MSVGNIGGSSVGGSSTGGDTYNDDDHVTHARGVIDDLVRNTGIIRSHVTPENVAQVAGLLDDADAKIEEALDLLMAPVEGMDRSGKPLDADRNGRIDSTEG